MVVGAHQAPSARSRRLRADLILLLVSFIWGTAFVAQRLAATNMNIYLFNGMRYLLGALVLLPLAWFVRSKQGVVRISARRAKLGIILAGVLLFAGATLQQLGLQTTTAANAGFITGLYVVLVPLILALFWRQWPKRPVLLAAFLAAVGLFLLSTGGKLQLAPGDALEFGGAILWALHVILIGALAWSAQALKISIGQNLVCGLLSLVLVVLSRHGAAFEGLETVWWTVVYTGILSIGMGYTLQIVGQKEAPPSDASIILSMEAVFAAIFGWIILDERLVAVQILGCLLMVAAMVMSQAGQIRQQSRFNELG